MSRIEFDILTGQFVVYDGIIHSPCRDKWKWDSPLLARFGRVTGKVALLSIIDPISMLVGYTWREIHWVICEDIQVFIEKRRNVFNFHLLDESLDIPDPAPILDALAQTESTLPNASSSHADDDESALVVGGADQTANEIVSSVLKTVSQLGKAANKGGGDELTKVIKSQRDGIVNKLKEFQEQQQQQQHRMSPSTEIITANSPSRNQSLNTTTTARRSSSMEIFAKESFKVVKSMSKAVERNVSEIQQSLKPPDKKKDYVKPSDDLLRIGFLVFRDARIFTKDVILSSSSGSSTNNVSPTAASANNNNIAKWSKPILLKEVIFDSRELTSPSNVRDENGLPIIGVDPERLIDLLVRKALAEMAKTNTGRVFNNAMTEVFAWMDSVGGGGVATGSAINTNAPRP